MRKRIVQTTARIAREKVVAAVELLGLDPATVMSIEITPTDITVTERVRVSYGSYEVVQTTVQMFWALSGRSAASRVGYPEQSPSTETTASSERRA